MDPSFFTVIFILGVAVYLAGELRRVEKRLAGTDDNEHDLRIDEDVQNALKSYHRHLEKLQDEKSALPRTDLWAISSMPDWEQQLIAKSEALRRLIEDAHGNTPDSYFVSQQAERVPMTYELAHALATLASTKKEIAIRRTEWAIRKIEVLGLLQKRATDFSRIADGEQELLDLQKEMGELESRLGPAKQELFRAYDAALGPIEARLGAG